MHLGDKVDAVVDSAGTADEKGHWAGLAGLSHGTIVRHGRGRKVFEVGERKEMNFCLDGGDFLVYVKYACIGFQMYSFPRLVISNFTY